MNLYYRSESSSSLTNEQIDSNFRTLDENRSITGSYTISGSLLPVDPSNSLGSNEQPFKDLYLSNNITVISGAFSASMNVGVSKISESNQTFNSAPNNPYFLSALASASGYEEEDDEVKLSTFHGFAIYDPEDSNTDPDTAIVDTIFVNATWSGVGPDDISFDDLDPITYFPNTTGSVGWQEFVKNETFKNNGGGFSIPYDNITTGGNWLDRSRLYATNPTSPSQTGSYNNNSKNASGGWWQSWQNYGMIGIIIGKAYHPWDQTAPRLWFFNSAAQSSFNRLANPGPGANFPDGRYGPYKSKASYFNLLESGSSYYDSTNPRLFPPPYEDGDIIVRMWNDNLIQWTSWYTLMYNEDNVHYYNISRSIEVDELLPKPIVNLYQDSINPGRVKMIGDYKGRVQVGNQNKFNSNGNIVGIIPLYESWSYDPVNPFISSSNLCLSLQNAGGTYTSREIRSDGFGPSYPNPTSYQIPFLGDYNISASVYGLSKINYPNAVKVAFNNTAQYGEPVTMGNVFAPFNQGSYTTTTAGSTAGFVWRYYPHNTNSHYNLTSSIPPYSGSSSGPYPHTPGNAYGYHQLKQWGPNGDCSWSNESSHTCVSILPIIPLTTAHYPESASIFWYTASLDNNDIVFTKVNKSSFVLNIPSTGTLYTIDDVLPDDRTVDLDGNNLTFSAVNGETFTIEAGNTNGQVAITGLATSSYSSLVGYNTSDGTLSVSSITNEQPYYYSTGSTTDNAQVTNDIKLELGLVYDYDNGINLDNSIYEVNTAGKYYINVNGTLGEDSEPLSNGLGWWKVALQVNGTTVAESTAKQSEVGEHYGGLDLMYVGDFEVNDTIQLVSDTSPSSATSSISNTTYRFSAEYLGA